MKLFIEFILLSSLVGLLLSKNNPNEQMQKGNRLSRPMRELSFAHLLNRKTYQYPEPLPSPSPRSLMREPYRRLVQGSRSINDRRVFRKTFEYPPAPVGHQVICHDLLDCEISYISVETKASIPVLLRGGAGHRHFSVVVRAQPWDPLEGTVRVYCRNLR